MTTQKSKSKATPEKAKPKKEQASTIKPVFNKTTSKEVSDYFVKSKGIIEGIRTKYADDKKYRLYSMPMNISKAMEQSIKADVKSAIENDIDFLNMSEGDLVDCINTALNENDYLAVAFFASIAQFVK